MTFKKLIAAIAVTASLCVPMSGDATTSNYTNYSTGQTLTAASLNSLQTNYTDGDNNILNGDIFTGNMLWYSGVDAIFYSDAGTTISASLDGATGNLNLDGGGDLSLYSDVATTLRAAIYGDTGNIVGAARTLGWINNCGITYAANTLTITDSSGGALSAANPCSVTVPSSTAGALTTLQFTAAVSSTFGDASDTDENLFGVTTGVAWGSAMPMFLHVCDGSGADYFGFSRNPARITTGAAAAGMAQEGDTDGDAQGDLFIMSSGLTLANEVNRPCLTVGSFQATMASGNDWAVGTLVAGRDGFGLFQEGVAFTMPGGQNGAITQGGTATHLYVAGGDGTTDVPTWATNQGQHTYWMNKDGSFRQVFNTLGSGNCTNGDVASQLAIVSPLIPSGEASVAYYTGTGYTTTGAGASSLSSLVSIANNSAYMYLAINTLVAVNASGLGSTADDIAMDVTLQAF